MTVLSTEGLSKEQLRAEGRALGRVNKKDALALVQKMTNTKRRRSKFNAQRTIVDGVSFHSKRESEAWLYLKIRERAGEIRDLKRQVPFKLAAFSKTGAPEYVTTYIADFQYFDVRQNRVVVSDAKGCVTAMFRLKAKMLKACHGIEVEIV